MLTIHRKQWLQNLRALSIFSQHTPNAPLVFNKELIYTEGAQGFLVKTLKEKEQTSFLGSVDLLMFQRILNNSKSAFLKLARKEDTLIVKESLAEWKLPFKEEKEKLSIGESDTTAIIYEELGWLSQALGAIVGVNSIPESSNYLFLTSDGVYAFDGFLFGSSQVSKLHKDWVLPLSYDTLQTIRQCGLDSQWSVNRHGHFYLMENKDITMVLNPPVVDQPDWDKLKEPVKSSTKLNEIGPSFLRLVKASRIFPNRGGHIWVHIYTNDNKLVVECKDESLNFQSAENWSGDPLDIHVDAAWLSMGASYCQYWGKLSDRMLVFSSERDTSKSTLIYYIPYF